ncbi:hypothetical protein P3T36_007758 [Kitasatospora sp. MAP12-15]|uniref:hypothetical protein n=1 Tax=unclassified Kitasatospora TaxID=2633591 RepID=UPI002473C634|nr:hypothetical protein [Kitasatospora sp. MAP12-44]MDH6115540.1 hypothetical protein [Kitasatospora sp. MAP12-44]
MVRGRHLSEQELSGGAVADVGGGDNDPEQQAEGVDDDVAFSAVILSPRRRVLHVREAR